MTAGPTRRMVQAGGQILWYELERKRVRNLNLRVRADGSVYVSANTRVPLREIDRFVVQKADFIRQAQARFARESAHIAQEPEVPKDACLALFAAVTEDLLPALAPWQVSMPQIRLRAMKSRWGSCAWKKGAVTLNTRLYHAPRPCLEYVVLHELCHFVHPDHSPAFRGLMTSLMPDWKARKRLLEQWSAQGEELH